MTAEDTDEEEGGAVFDDGPSPKKLCSWDVMAIFFAVPANLSRCFMVFYDELAMVCHRHSLWKQERAEHAVDKSIVNDFREQLADL